MTVTKHSVISAEDDPGTRFNVYIVRGSLRDLTAVDFSCVNIACINMATDHLKIISDGFKAVNDQAYSILAVVKRTIRKMHDEPKYIHVLLPLDFKKPVEEYNYSRSIDVLKLLFPSDLQYETVAHFILRKGNEVEWEASSGYHFYTSGASFMDNYLTYPLDKPISKVNDFITLFFQRIDQLKYVRVAFDAYINSFLNMPAHMSFVSLSMALETIVSEKTELLFRIRRSVALICGENDYHASIIYENIKLIYDLRSSIVHGELFKYHLVTEYFPYLRSLVSRLIIELIYLNIQTPKALQENLLFAGYIDRNSIIKTEKLAVNLFTHSDTMQSLKKNQ